MEIVNVPPMAALSTKRKLLICSTVLFGFVLTSCTTSKRLFTGTDTSAPTKDGAPLNPRAVDDIPDAVPQDEPPSKYGNMSKYEVFGKEYKVMPKPHSKGYKAKGLASWYGTKFHGKRTSSGEPYDLYGMTAAHKHLPLPTYVKVKNLENGKEVIVKVNDRGPFHDDRLIDLSYAAAKKLGVYDTGTAHVEVTAIHPENYNRHLLAKNSTKASKTKSVAKSKPVVEPVTNLAQAESTKPFYIQVGAFKDKANADKLASKLSTIASARDLSIPIQSFEPIDGSVYKVRFGPMHSAAQAYEIKETLADANWVESTVVQD